MTKNIFLTIATLFYFIFQGHTQINTSVPPSPNSSSLGIYGEIPVSLYTGTPNINIPLYSTVSDNIPLNISMNYYSGGIQVEQEASWVGLGWSLNSGGVITRTVNDIPDEFSDLNQSFAPCNTDRIPDVYFFNFSGYTGKFVIDIPSREIHIIQQSDIKIEELSPRGSGFKITDPNGYIYTFNYEEIQEITTRTALGEYSPYDYASAWYLTKIQSPAGQEINFNYESPVSYDCTHYHISENYEEPRGPVYYLLEAVTVNGVSRDASYLSSIGVHTNCGTDVLYQDIGLDNLDVSITQINSKSVYLKSISFNNGVIDFVTEDRSDISSPTAGLSNKRLKRIDISKYIDGLKTNVKSYEFIYDYFVSRLRLRTLKEFTNTSNPLLYSFDYNNTTLPIKISKDRDHWGFYNGPVNNTTLNPELGANREPDNNYVLAGTLYSITYPTGGKTVFEFESNEYSNRGSTGFKKGGGLRIKSIKNYSFNNNLASLKRYEYVRKEGQVNVSSGKLIYPLVYSKAMLKSHWFHHCSGTYTYQSPTTGQTITENLAIVIEYSSSYTDYFEEPESPLCRNEGSPVCYDKITEYRDENGSLGKTEYEFKNIESPNPSTEDFYIPRAPNDNGELLKETNYVINGSPTEYRRISETDYAYETINTNQISLFSNSTYLHALFNNCNNQNYVQRYIISDWSRILSSTSYSYSQIDDPSIPPVVSQKNYSYKYNGTNPINRLVGSLSVYNSKGQQILTEFKYPQDYSTTDVYSEMISKHIIAPIVEETQKNITLGNTPIKTNESNYGYYGFYPSNILPMSLKEANSTNSPTESIMEFINYDDHLNPTAFKGRDGLNIGLQWGYNKTYQTVRVVNAANTYRDDFTTVDNASNFTFPIGGSEGNTKSSQNNITLTHMGDIILSIGNNMPPNADINITYTVTGPVNYSGYICLSYNSNITCGGTPSSITIHNVPSGSYTLAYVAHTSFGSYFFNGVLNYIIRQPAPGGIKEFYYQGFEENFSNASTVSPYAGKKCYYGDFTVPYLKPDSKNYKINYHFLQNGIWTNKTDNYIDNMIITDGDAIDEIRVYPDDAYMTTYTYEPLIGLTSETDRNGKTTYYEYDEYNRLKLIRDDDRNILKKICYNYAGQPEICLDCSSFTANWQNTTTAIRCQQNNGANTGYQEQEQKDINPCSATYNQLRWVQIAYNTTVCPIPLYYAVNFNNQTSYPYYLYFTSTTGSTNYSFSVYPGSSQPGSVISGTYNITASPMYSAGTSQLILNGSTQTGTYFSFPSYTVGSTLNFTLAPVSTGCIGSCTCSANSGISFPTQGVSCNGNSVSGYLVFYASYVMSPNVSYTIGTIGSNCAPSTTRTFTNTSGGRTFSVSVSSSGSISVMITSGTSLPANNSVTLSSFSYSK